MLKISKLTCSGRAIQIQALRTQSEKRDPPQCLETQPSTRRGNSKTLALSALALISDINILPPSTTHAAPRETTQDTVPAEQLHVMRTTDVKDGLNVEAATMVTLRHQSTQYPLLDVTDTPGMHNPIGKVNELSCSSAPLPVIRTEAQGKKPVMCLCD